MPDTGKEITLLMQTLNTLSTPEEKLTGLCKKYAELVSVSPLALLLHHELTFQFLEWHLCASSTAGGASKQAEADASAAEEADAGGAGEGQPEDGAQQGHPGSQQAGEPLPGAAEAQPYTQGAQHAQRRDHVTSFRLQSGFKGN